MPTVYTICVTCQVTFCGHGVSRSISRWDPDGSILPPQTKFASNTDQLASASRSPSNPDPPPSLQSLAKLFRTFENYLRTWQSCGPTNQRGCRCMGQLIFHVISAQIEDIRDVNPRYPHSSGLSIV